MKKISRLLGIVMVLLAATIGIPAQAQASAAAPESPLVRIEDDLRYSHAMTEVANMYHERYTHSAKRLRRLLKDKSDVVVIASAFELMVTDATVFRNYQIKSLRLFDDIACQLNLNLTKISNKDMRRIVSEAKKDTKRLEGMDDPSGAKESLSAAGKILEEGVQKVMQKMQQKMQQEVRQKLEQKTQP